MRGRVLLVYIITVYYVHVHVHKTNVGATRTKRTPLGRAIKKLLSKVKMDNPN